MKAKKQNYILIMGLLSLIASILFVAVLGGLYLYRSVGLFSSTFNKSFLAQLEAERVNTVLVSMHSSMKDFVYAGEKAKTAQADIETDAARANIHFKKLLSLDPDNVYLKEVIVAYDAWEPLRNKTISLINEGQREEAIAYMLGVEDQQIKIILDKTERLVEYENRDATYAYSAAQSMMHEAVFNLIGLTFLAILLALVIAVYVQRKSAEFETALYREKEALRITFESIGDGVVTTDTEERVLQLNKVAEKLTGLTGAEVFGKFFSEVFAITDTVTGETKDLVAEVLKKDEICTPDHHTVLIAKDGTRRFISDSAAPIKDQRKKTVGVVLIFRDVTEEKEAQEKLLVSERRLKSAQEIAHVGNWEYSPHSKTFWLSEEGYCIFGFRQPKPGLSWDEVRELIVEEDLAHVENALDVSFQREREPFIEFKIQKVDTGYIRVIQANSVLVFDEGGYPSKIIGTVQDITERKRNEEAILFLSYHDALTGLYNRTFFEEEIRHFESEDVLPLSVIMGDINGLKLINDIFGHSAGDSLICDIAQILRSCCRDGDIIARMGGDEFCILLPNTNVEQAEVICECVRRRCDDYPFSTDKGLCPQSISLGCSEKTEESQPIGSVFKNAEDRMYRLKLLQRKKIHGEIVSSIKTTMYERCQETEEHADRMVELSKKLGQRLHLNGDQLGELELAASLHDIGKISIDNNILNKPGKLSDEEWLEIRKHPEIGYRIAQAAPELTSIADIILCHHERWDGKGYPSGLSGEAIPLFSRIIAVIDSYDAMTHDRPYRAAIPKEDALDEIRMGAGRQYDPYIANVFIEMISKSK